MFLPAAVTINQSVLSTIGLLFIGLVAGSWLTLKPQHLAHVLFLDSSDETGNILIQILEQILLGIVIAPLIFNFLQWFYF